VDKKVSLKDVAKHVGVSTALVSYVLNGKEKEARVSDEMVKKIRKAAAKLKYHPNMIAKSLKSGKTNTIGLIVADISNPFFSNIARIIEDEAQKQGFVVIFGSSDESHKKQQDLITVFLNRQVDAFILSPAAGSESQIRMLQKRGIPVVLIDRYFGTMVADCVHINNYQAAYKAVQHLITNGRKKIGMVSYSDPMDHMYDRVRGYQDALKDNKISTKKEWQMEVSYADVDGDMSKVLERLLDPLQLDAILFASNSLAVSGLKRILRKNVKVPEQLAAISFDETDVFDFFYSPITYISQSVGEIGKEAVKLAAERIMHNKKKTVRKTIDSTLVIRESCGVNLNGSVHRPV
jgi:LacI family transcriptional regulator